MKLFTWGLALVLLPATAAFLALKFYFTPDRIRSLAVEYAERNLHREISLDAAALNLRGFSLKNLKVAEAGGFGHGEFLSAEDFSVRPDFRALLRKELRINSIRASGVTLHLLQARTHGYNFSDLLPGRPQAAARKPQTGGRPAKSLRLGISYLRVRNSRIIYAAADSSTTVTLSDLNLSARSLTSEKPFPFEAGFTLGIRSPSLTAGFPVHAKGSAALGGWNPEKGRAEIADATLKAGRIEFKARGTLMNLAEPDAEISLRVKAFSSTDIKPYFPAVPARILLPAVTAEAAFKLTPKDLLLKKLEFRAGPAMGSLKGRFSWDPAFDYRLTAEIQGQTPEMNTTEVARKFRSVPKNIKMPLAYVGARMAVSPKKVRLLAASLTAKSIKATASGEFFPAPAFKASGRLKLSAGDLHDLGEMLPRLRKYDLKGSASGDLDFSLAGAMLLRGRLNFSGAGATVSGTRFSGMKGSVVLARSGATGKTSDAGAGAFGFDLSGATCIGAIFHPNLRGGETTVRYDLKNITGDLSGLSGSAAFGVAGGAFHDLRQLAESSVIARTVFYPFSIPGKASRAAAALKFPDFTSVKFSRMEGDCTFRNGIMKIEKSLLRADAADADFSGSIDLVNDALDLNIITTPKAGLSLPLPVSVTVRGPFSRPSVTPDATAVVRQPVLENDYQSLLKGPFK